MSLDQGPEQPRIGVDEWVASAEERRARSLTGRAQDALARVPAGVQLVALVVPFAMFPLFVDSQYLMQVGVDTLVFVLLALGLNVAVGWVGLLDLGYVAFFGIGAYLYASVASPYAGRHWDAVLVIPLIAVAVAIAGFLVGLPSRRLVGDYLAIVTLFFLQLWLVVLINASWSRGPNGISDLYPLQFFGRQITSLDAYFYVALIAFVVIISFLYLLNRSRTGRAWRALREDELAAELMTMPVSRLKLMGFAVGAGIAGVAGAIYAPVQGAVFPANFDLVLLITLYAMVVLGGAGSLVGVTVGAVLINGLLEALNDADNASWIFYGVVGIALLALLRPWWQPVAVLGATVVLGFAVHEIAE
ncbi:MAG: branched-chain amino acid ABC transporter permease [Actinomycetota bacterium]|nr:branched-chain amino acid ABC transporter permease [Actinomycetota bacterium]